MLLTTTMGTIKILAFLFVFNVAPVKSIHAQFDQQIELRKTRKENRIYRPDDYRGERDFDNMFRTYQFRVDNNRWLNVGRYGKGVRPFMITNEHAVEALKGYKRKRIIQDAGIAIGIAGLVYYTSNLIRSNGSSSKKVNSISYSMMGIGIALNIAMEYPSRKSLKKAVKRHNNVFREGNLKGVGKK